jgi:hypothetical protein
MPWVCDLATNGAVGYEGAMPALFFLGQSHLTALLQAWPTAAPLGWEMDYLQEDSRTLLEDEALRADVRARLAARDVCVSVLGGNDHAVLAMLNHDRVFDVVLPEAPGLPLAPDAELVPAGLLRAEIARRAAPHLTVLAAFAAAAPGRVLHVESPPPIPSVAHIAAHPGVFRDEIAARGVAPARLRYKAWRLQSDIYRQACQRAGVAFVAAPQAMQDEQGMMREEGWNTDPTHGNERYGAAVLAELGRRLA